MTIKRKERNVEGAAAPAAQIVVGAVRAVRQPSQVVLRSQERTDQELTAMRSKRRR
jgi:hypothetical protein